MNQAEFIEHKIKQRKNKERWLAVNPYLTDDSGIYILTRVDENQIKYGYVGQAKHILTRLADHLKGYQHIDLSIKKHGLQDEEHPNGWFVTQVKVAEELLDKAEQEYIKLYADMGYQLRNKTSGGQGVGKSGIADNKPSKGYYDGKKQGRADVINEIKSMLKYIQISPKNDGKLANRMVAKFWQIMGENDNG